MGFPTWDVRPDEILYEDRDLIAVDKPSGIPSQATRDPRRDHAYGAVQRFLDAREARKTYLALHHRLDVETSGVLLMVKDRRANKAIAEAFRERTAQKTYAALVRDPHGSRRVGQAWSVEDHLARDRSIPKSRPSRFHSVRSGGDYALTEFEVLDVVGDIVHIAARPKTGRTHQIRVHLAEGALPIIGDERYGGEGASRMMLHAAALTLPHPVTGEALTIEAEVPEAFTAALRGYL